MIGKAFLSSCFSTLFALLFICSNAASQSSPYIPTLWVPRFVDAGPLATQVSFQIKNTGGGILNWNIGDISYKQSGNWISAVEPLSGSTQTSSTVTIFIAREGLAVGTYSAVIPVFSNGGSGQITVSMDVTPPFVAPNRIELGTALTSASFTITNHAQVPLSWSSEVIDSDNQSLAWIFLTPQQGSLEPGDNQSVIVSVDRTGLAAGTYRATVALTFTLGDTQAVERIEVTMQVAEQEDTPSCPITFVLGDTHKGLSSYRMFRDRVLARSGAGEACIGWYYAAAPSVCGMLQSFPLLRQTATAILRASLPLIETLSHPSVGTLSHRPSFGSDMHDAQAHRGMGPWCAISR